MKGRLKQKNLSISFLNPKISKEKDLRGIITYCTREKAFLILDHYSLDDNYQKSIADAGIKFLLFDSHGISDFYADAILHASPSATQNLYEPLVKKPNAMLLLGTSYAIMDPEFAKERESLQARTKLKNILICMGGGNDNGASLKILRFLKTFPVDNIKIEVIAGNNHPDSLGIQSLCNSTPHFSHVPGTNDMPKFMRRADLGIIAPGTLSYEAACLGMPMLLCVTADNQKMNAEGWEKLGCAINLGEIDELQKENFTSHLNVLVSNFTMLQKMSEVGMQAVDGLGVSRVKGKIDQLIHH